MIDFCVSSPTEEIFWQSWVTAGIVTQDPETGLYTFTPEYPGVNVSSQTREGWTPTYKTGNMILNDEGNLVEEELPVDAWHANVRVMGPLVDQMTAGKPQVDAEGNPLSVFDRTWAVQIFNLTWREADPTTGFPAGYRSAQGVQYADPRDLKTPTNVWL